MMHAWSFSVRTVDDVGRLVRTLGKHRYVHEVDHRLHPCVDQALSDRDAFGPHARAFEERCKRDASVDISSRDPTLWRSATVEDVTSALGAFWTPGDDALRARERLLEAIARTGLPPASHAPFACPADDPPHPELILLDWTLLPVDELDTERHAGALAALEDSNDEINPSAPVYQEGPILAAPELCGGFVDGAFVGEFLVWSDAPYAYADYVFRGASKAAKLEEPPVGYRDI